MSVSVERMMWFVNRAGMPCGECQAEDGDGNFCHDHDTPCPIRDALLAEIGAGERWRQLRAWMENERRIAHEHFSPPPYGLARAEMDRLEAAPLPTKE